MMKPIFNVGDTIKPKLGGKEYYIEYLKKNSYLFDDDSELAFKDQDLWELVDDEKDF